MLLLTHLINFLSMKTLHQREETSKGAGKKQPHEFHVSLSIGEMDSFSWVTKSCSLESTWRDTHPSGSNSEDPPLRKPVSPVDLITLSLLHLAFYLLAGPMHKHLQPAWVHYQRHWCWLGGRTVMVPAFHPIHVKSGNKVGLWSLNFLLCKKKILTTFIS